MKFKINIFGSIFGITGYDSHTRSLINALDKVADCRLLTQLAPGWESKVNDAELKMIMNPRDTCDYNAEKYKDDLKLLDVDEPLDVIKKVLDKLVVGFPTTSAM